jgi:lipopolysaccharide transport system ATP-binding protein
MNPTEPNDAWPTLFHITHWKAGSQWIHEILQACCGPRLVTPQIDNAQIVQRPIKQGRVYPTCYATREEFFSIKLPVDYKAFVVIRDLRDVLVSGYFSIRYSHPQNDVRLMRWRHEVARRELKSGLCYLMDEWLHFSAEIISSWLAPPPGIRLLRYEDLLVGDSAVLHKLLIEDLGLPMDPAVLSCAVESCRFENMAKRIRGEERQTDHRRKGVAGDWRNYFDQHLAEKFDRRYGEILAKAGYARCLDELGVAP